MLGAGLGEAEEGIAAIASDIATGSGANLAPVTWQRISFRSRWYGGISDRSSTISNSALLAHSRASSRSSVMKPVRRRKMRSNRVRSTARRFLLGLA
jgi:hypothetical protein